MSEQHDRDMSESEFRALADALYRRVGQAFDDIDPDAAECEESHGSVTIQPADGARWGRGGTSMPWDS